MHFMRVKVIAKVKENVKLSLCFSLTEHHAMKTYCGSGVIAPHILWPRY